MEDPKKVIFLPCNLADTLTDIKNAFGQLADEELGVQMGGEIIVMLKQKFPEARMSTVMHTLASVMRIYLATTGLDELGPINETIH